jgi:hypothetical protein
MSIDGMNWQKLENDMAKNSSANFGNWERVSPDAPLVLQRKVGMAWQIGTKKTVWGKEKVTSHPTLELPRQ